MLNLQWDIFSDIIIHHKEKFSELPKIVIYKDPVLINQYFDAKTDVERLSIIDKMKKERGIDKRLTKEKLRFSKWPLQVFIPIDTIQLDPVCVKLKDCLLGSGKGCLTTNGSNNFTFTINSITKANNNLGYANTTLTINPSAPKIKKIEFLLSDIRMFSDSNFLGCNRTVLGNFQTNTTNIGALSNSPIVTPSGFYREKNIVLFQSTNFSAINGVYNINFQLPVSSLNCYGNLEVNILCKVYFEDCSICYQAISKDYRATYSWHWPGEVILIENVHR